MATIDEEYRKTLADLNMIAQHAADVGVAKYTYDHEACLNGLATKLVMHIREFSATNLIDLLDMPKA